MSFYKGLDGNKFWKSGVAQSSPFLFDNIYKKKFEILPHWNIATAGSCFAQHNLEVKCTF